MTKPVRVKSDGNSVKIYDDTLSYSEQRIMDAYQEDLAEAIKRWCGFFLSMDKDMQESLIVTLKKLMEQND